MKIPGLPKCHLTYCSNIHPGESWQSHFASLQAHLPVIKKQLGIQEAFGVGLRLSALAAEELYSNRKVLLHFKNWLQAEGFYVFTINGFPYGTFHGEAIKEKVYQPDWASTARLTYTKQLAVILAELLPEGLSGSISTVPVGFKPDFENREQLLLARDALYEFSVFVNELEAKTGKCIRLALEPEPGCYLEDTQGTISFFNDVLYTRRDSETLRRYVGVCLDTCHASVMFERPLLMAKQLDEAGIPIVKIQLTAALKTDMEFLCKSEDGFSALNAYAEGSYLHQSCVKSLNGERVFFLDLPEALESVFRTKHTTETETDELRSHFHVPVFLGNLGGMQTTQAELLEFLGDPGAFFGCTHFEVETYTFEVLPEQYRKADVDESIVREIDWVLEVLK